MYGKPMSAPASIADVPHSSSEYLAYIHLYTRLHRRPPAEADLQRLIRAAEA